MESITYKGNWFLPEDHEKRLPGTLAFSKENGIDLELDGSFADPDDSNTTDVNVILGETLTGQRVTLYRCNLYQHHHHSSGNSSSRFSAIFILLGDYFQDESQCVFDKSVVSFYNLNEWLGIHGFSSKLDTSGDGYQINYQRPASIPFTIGEIKGAFDFDMNHSSYDDLSFEVEQIRQRTVISMHYGQPQSLVALLKDIRHFQNFLTLTIYSATYPSLVKLYSNKSKLNIQGKEVPRPIALYYAPTYFKPVKKANSFLFSFRNIKEDFTTVIQKWFHVRNLIDDTIYLLFNSYYDTTFNESKFLDLARAIETFHRRLRNNQERSKEDHEALITSILEKADDQHREWLSGKLLYSNEPSLRKRLKEIYSEIENDEIRKIIPKKKVFINDVVNSRNYHTHYDPGSKSQAKEGVDLYYLSGKLRVVLVCALLKEIGIANDQIEDFLKKNYHRLFQNLEV